MSDENTSKGNLLLVEDDVELATLVKACLTKEGFTVDMVHTGDKVMDMISSKDYSVLVLDWMLPGKEGVDIIREYRAQGGPKAILMVTGNRTTDEIEKGIDSGADDYLTKPFSMKELAARVRALLRRSKKYVSTVIKIDNVTLDTQTHKAFVGEEEVHLYPREFSLLQFLMTNPGRVFSPEELLDFVWEAESDATPDSIRTFIKRIRKKISRDGQECILQNVHGVGYKVEAQL